MAKKIEETIEIIYPVQPQDAVPSEMMVGLLRDKVNELILVVNSLREETIKLKKDKEV